MKRSRFWLLFYLISDLCWTMGPTFTPKESRTSEVLMALRPFLNRNPESVLVYEQGKLTQKLAFMSVKSKEGIGFLATKAVGKNNYQNAFFVSKSRIEKKEKDYTIDNFELVPVRWLLSCSMPPWPRKLFSRKIGGERQHAIYLFCDR